MLNIIKYEWMNRWKFFLAGVILFVLLDIEIIRKAITNSGSGLWGGILSLVIFAMGFALLLDHIGRMYTNLFKEEGYFLFTTPLNGYRILGGKIITVFFEALAIILFWGCMVFVDYLILSSEFPRINIDFAFFSKDVSTLVLLIFSVIIGYLVFLLMIYLSMTLAKSIFAVFRYGKLLSFVFFILVSKGVSKFSKEFDSLVNLDIHNIAKINAGFQEFLLMNTVVFILLFIATGYLLDRKINL